MHIHSAGSSPVSPEVGHTKIHFLKSLSSEIEIKRNDVHIQFSKNPRIRGNTDKGTPEGFSHLIFKETLGVKEEWIKIFKNRGI